MGGGGGGVYLLTNPFVLNVGTISVLGFVGPFKNLPPRTCWVKGVYCVDICELIWG